MLVSKDPKIIQRPEMLYIGMTISHEVTLPDNTAVPELWSVFLQRSSEIEFVSGPYVGIASDVYEDETADYTAAIQVTNTDRVPHGMEATFTEAGQYAEFTHRGPLSDLYESMHYIHDEWLPRSDYTGNCGSQIEIYPEDTDINDANFEMKILVPLIRE
jgi:AraC family transcriptional regulator